MQNLLERQRFYYTSRPPTTPYSLGLLKKGSDIPDAEISSEGKDLNRVTRRDSQLCCLTVQFQSCSASKETM
ncbi:Hypothetical protein FKW44_002151 [Caligus rogercresseyi]|uniref:Uncharacterized protein n=1 Tax=Caligus rogercresseyi TaxID=217165 RepID=A0A7T8QW49_CALRO|nr:Hypothetical protein FKW44_002151 [Caligus rogercresseyi]